MDNDELLEELRSTFLEELEEVLEELESAFLRFEKDANDNNTISELFRYFHNIKGSSKAIGFDSLATFTHSAETVLSKLRAGELIADDSIVSSILKTIDLMGAFFQEARVGNFDCTEMFAPHKKVLDEIINADDAPQQNNGLQLFDDEPVAKVPEQPVEPVANTVENEVVQSQQAVDEALAPKPNHETSAVQSKQDKKEDNKSVEKKDDKSKKVLTEETIKIPIRRINDLLDLFGEQVILQSSLDHVMESNLEEERVY